MKTYKNIMIITAVVVASATFAAEKKDEKVTTLRPAQEATGTDLKKENSQIIKPATPFKWGGDVRLREVYMDNIPYANVPIDARGGANQFQRYRTRIWGEYHPLQNQNLYFRGRLVNEFRTDQAGAAAKTWSAFDETVIDNLFVDWKTSLWDIRVGRQDMIYGTGKLILDGTPKDGSRTIYFNAAKAVYKGIDNTTVDLFAMYTQAQDPLALHTQDRDIVGLHKIPYEGAEAGGGVYVKNKTHKGLPWEAYWIIKTEEEGLDDEINTRRNTSYA